MQSNIQEILDIARLSLGDHYYVSRAAMIGVVVSLFRYRKMLTKDRNELLGICTGNLFFSIFAASHVAFWLGFPQAESLFAYLTSMYGMPTLDVCFRFFSRATRELDVNGIVQTYLRKRFNHSSPYTDYEQGLENPTDDIDIPTAGADVGIP